MDREGTAGMSELEKEMLPDPGILERISGCMDVTLVTPDDCILEDNNT